jgi:UDP-glucose:(heptosyl)LPS alpha-1,3-glucosyltransferase
MIAQDFERKGLGQAIEAMKLVDDPQAVLLVVGRDDVITWQVRARQLGIADRVIFAGATHDPYAFYKAADLFVLPTKHDPCSLVVLEALAMGVPVISTIRNGACEIMTDGVHGSVLKNPADVDALADAMKKWSDPGVRKTASDLCLQLRGELSYEKHLDRLETIYRGLHRQRETATRLSSSKSSGRAEPLL